MSAARPQTLLILLDIRTAVNHWRLTVFCWQQSARYYRVPIIDHRVLSFDWIAIGAAHFSPDFLFD